MQVVILYPNRIWHKNKCTLLPSQCPLCIIDLLKDASLQIWFLYKWVLYIIVWSSIKENVGECGHPYPHDPPWLYPSGIIDLFYASLPPCFFQQFGITYSNIIWHKGKCRWCGQPYPKKWKAYYCYIFSFKVVTISF